MAEIDLVLLAISIIVRIVVLSIVLWGAGRLLAGAQKAKFTDAIWIAVLGTVIGAIVEYIFVGVLGLLGSLLVLFIWLALVKHFFDTGWLRALAIAIVAVIFYVILLAILGLLQIGINIFT